MHFRIIAYLSDLLTGNKPVARIKYNNFLLSSHYRPFNSLARFNEILPHILIPEFRECDTCLPDGILAEAHSVS